MKKFSIVILCALLSGCATTPVSLTQADPVPPARHLAFKQAAEGTAPVVVRRDSGFQAGACATEFFVNGTLAAYIRSGERITLHVPAGETILGAMAGAICAGGLVELQVKLTAGRAAHYRIGYDTNGALGLFATATR